MGSTTPVHHTPAHRQPESILHMNCHLQSNTDNPAEAPNVAANSLIVGPDGIPRRILDPRTETTNYESNTSSHESNTSISLDDQDDEDVIMRNHTRVLAINSLLSDFHRQLQLCSDWALEAPLQDLYARLSKAREGMGMLPSRNEVHSSGQIFAEVGGPVFVNGKATAMPTVFERWDQGERLISRQSAEKPKGHDVPQVEHEEDLLESDPRLWTD